MRIARCATLPSTPFGNSSIPLSISVIVIVCITFAYLFLAYLNSFLLQLPAFIATCALIVSALSVLGCLADKHIQVLEKQLSTQAYLINGIFIIGTVLLIRLLFIKLTPVPSFPISCLLRLYICARI